MSDYIYVVRPSFSGGYLGVYTKDGTFINSFIVDQFRNGIEIMGDGEIIYAEGTGYDDVHRTDLLTGVDLWSTGRNWQIANVFVTPDGWSTPSGVKEVVSTDSDDPLTRYRYDTGAYLGNEGSLGSNSISGTCPAFPLLDHSSGLERYVYANGRMIYLLDSTFSSLATKTVGSSSTAIRGVAAGAGYIAVVNASDDRVYYTNDLLTVSEDMSTDNFTAAEGIAYCGDGIFVLSTRTRLQGFTIDPVTDVATSLWAIALTIPSNSRGAAIGGEEGKVWVYLDGGIVKSYNAATGAVVDELTNIWPEGPDTTNDALLIYVGPGRTVMGGVLNASPNVPTNLQVTSLRTDTTPVFSADISDPDTAQQLKARFEVRTLAGTVLGTLDSSFRTGAGTVTAEWADALALGYYQVRVKTIDDAGEESVYTDWVDFTITKFVSPINLNLIWNVIGTLPKDLSLLWNIAEGNQKDLELVWNTAVSVSEDLELLWNKKTPWTEVTENTDIWRRVY